MIPDEEILAVDLFYFKKAFLYLTFLFIHVGQKEVAQLTCNCERHIGTQSGGMDQVIVSVQISIFYFFPCLLLLCGKFNWAWRKCLCSYIVCPCYKLTT